MTDTRVVISTGWSNHSTSASLVIDPDVLGSTTDLFILDCSCELAVGKSVLIHPLGNKHRMDTDSAKSENVLADTQWLRSLTIQ